MVNKREPGIKGIFHSMFHPQQVVKKAVDGVNFRVSQGEIIGFIGPNGAGKSTTIKMLTGILVPSEGTIKVKGIIPYKDRKENAKNIGVVFGQRTQLWWNLPLTESFDLIKTIYRIPDPVFQKNIRLFSEVLDIDQFLEIPVRQLSLGQRMRGEIAASLLHDPKIVFLDEPTIGLDLFAKERIRDFIAEINKVKQVTVILTTHDLSDIEKLCNRLIVIDHGAIIYDGSIVEIRDKFSKERVLVVDLEEAPINPVIEHGTLLKTEGSRNHILFNRDEITAVELIHSLSAQYKIKDFSLKETEIDSIIKYVYNFAS